MSAKVHELNAWKYKLDMGERGVKRNLTNLMLHLQNLPDLGKSFRFNEQTHWPEWQGRKLEDHDFIDIRLMIEREGFQPSEKDVRPAVLRLAYQNSYNPIVDYLNGLAWDGQPRINAWMQEMLGAPDDDFTKLVGPKALIAAVARVMDPGCQVDTMLVLEGPQGIRKSSAIQVLFSPQYAYEFVSGFDNHRQLAVSMMGAWCVELAEFVSVNKSHAGSVKGLISMRSDRVQLPYGKSLSDLPRRIVFWGTINPGATGYLTDATGNRRYWPVTVTKVDIPHLTEKRDQLWAEALQRYNSGERWWIEGDEQTIAEEMQAEREQSDPWVAILQDKLTGVDRITANDALAAMGIAYEHRDNGKATRAAEALKVLGFKDARTRVGSPTGQPIRIWTR